MKKVIAMIALAAITLGTVSVYAAVPAKMQQDTVKKKVKKKGDKVKVKTKKKDTTAVS